MTTDRSTAPTRFGIAHIVVTVIFGLIAAWFLFQGLSQLIEFPLVLEQQGVADSTPWAALWIGLLQVPVFFVGAVLVLRRRPIGQFALGLMVAVASIAAVRLSIIAIASGVIVT
ncbi:hypothetical protein EV140_2359 [Microcella alkaliphila]|uniref:Uncharacterized protein n=1 Tax=Microcella alkaliphila TaxID=279828 RepID=A0A4V2FMK7_9MICO|nr:hypothetical protein [Microcella alkaliphila]RZT58119.1 hypothetical protein EV140_2359 [Microcella alkaliphila]